MVQAVLPICLVGLGLALGMAAYRTVKGPSVTDRVAALDAAGAMLINFVIVGAILLDDRNYLTYAVVLSALSFVSTVATGKYIQRGGVIGDGPTD